MIPAAHVVHELPNRIRLQIPSRRGDVPFFAVAMQRLYDCAEITAFSANPRTGSIVIRHSGDAGAIADFAARHGLFDVRRELSAPADARPGPAGPADRPRGKLSGAIVGLSTLVLYQTARGRVIGSAAESFWMGHQARKRLKRPWVATAYTAIGLGRLVSGPVLGSALSLAYYALSMHSADRDKRHSADRDKPLSPGEPLPAERH